MRSETVKGERENDRSDTLMFADIPHNCRKLEDLESERAHLETNG